MPTNLSGNKRVYMGKVDEIIIYPYTTIFKIKVPELKQSVPIDISKFGKTLFTDGNKAKEKAGIRRS